MAVDQKHKELIWIGSSRKDMMALPRAVQRTFGYGLYLAQLGDKPPDAKPLKGFHGAGVIEIIENYRGDAFRAVYTATLRHQNLRIARFSKKGQTWNRNTEKCHKFD